MTDPTSDRPHLFDPETHNEPLPDLWANPVRYGPVGCATCGHSERDHSQLLPLGRLGCYLYHCSCIDYVPGHDPH
jgi:hypothetical protein